MPPHDSENGRQAQPAATSLRAEEGIEDALSGLLVHSDPCVGHPDTGPRSCLGSGIDDGILLVHRIGLGVKGGNLDPTSSPSDCVGRIGQQIQDDLT